MTNKEKYKKVFDVLASSEQISLEVEQLKNNKNKNRRFGGFGEFGEFGMRKVAAAMAICLLLAVSGTGVYAAVSYYGIFGIENLYTNATGANEVREAEYSMEMCKIDVEGIDYSEYYSADGNMEKVVASSDKKLAEVGKNIAITEAEINQYTVFYELQGEENPEEKALSYAKERNALYVKAMENGYDVTDEEVYAYLDELKAMLQKDNNQEMYQSAMEGFLSEDDYWAYEFAVYKVDLPIQKYNAAMKETYREKSNLSEEEFEKAWSEEFEQMKEEAVREQNFRKSM